MSNFDLSGNSEYIILIGSVILFSSIIAGKAGNRFGIPALLLFLGIGMLFGSDGLGIHFSSPEVTQMVGMVSLCIILFSGGMDTNLSEIRPIAREGIALATLGVLLTTLIGGGLIYYLFHFFFDKYTLSFAESLLLAAVMSSTDSASVFSILRSKKLALKENLRPMLELESGSNDPMAYMLTVLLISYIQVGGFDIGSSLLAITLQLGIGGAIGYLGGKGAVRIVNHIKIGNPSLYPILLMSIAFFIFSATTLCEGNGYLAVYILGLIIGNTKIVHKKGITTFFDGFSWLCQIVMFLTLGLLVNPRELFSVALIGLSIGLILLLIARPASVFLSLLPFKKISYRARFYVSWIGLRGAVPIIFATYPMIADLQYSDICFNIVFFITILSLLLQGTTVAWTARKLGLVNNAAGDRSFDIDLPEDIKSAMSEIMITKSVLEHGNKLMDIQLPEHTLAVMVKRKDHYFIPKGNTILFENDRMLIISDDDNALLQSYQSLGVKNYTMKKN